jgi:hypothetical protein
MFWYAQMKGFGEKALSRCCIAFSREKEVDCRTAGVHRPVQVHPFAFHPHVRLVHPPRVVGRLEVPAQAPLQFRSIPLDPSPDGDVIHREHTLGQKLRDVAVRKREAQIPADRQENDLRFKLAPLEQAANRRVQKEHPISLSRQACELQLFQMPSWEDVFRDEVSIDLGSDFVSTLVTTIATCDLLVAIVDSACFGNRFDDETDFVRRELLLALTTRRTLVPVVMEGVHWPPQRPLPEEAGNVGQLQAIMHVTQAQPVALRIAKLYRSHRLLDAPALHTGQIQALAIAEAGSEAVIVSSDDQGVVRFTALSTGAEYRPPMNVNDRPSNDWNRRTAVFDGNGGPACLCARPVHCHDRDRLLVAGRQYLPRTGIGEFIRIQDIETGDIVANVLEADSAGIRALLGSNIMGDTRILSADQDGHLRMWDCDLNQLTPRGLHEGGVSAVAEFNGTLITGGLDGSVQAWTLKDLKCLGVPRQEHTRTVSAIACATIRNRHVVVSGSENGSVRSYLLEGLIQASAAE